MKRMKFLTCAAACLAVGMSFTSCVNSDEPTQNNEVTNIEVVKANVITVTSNVEATFKVGNQSHKGTKATFEIESKEAILSATVESDGTDWLKSTQEVKLNFSDEVNTADIAFNFVKKSTNTVPQAEAKGTIVYNDAANQSATEGAGVVAAIEVPSDVTITGNTTGDFSITASIPATEVKGTEEKAAEVSVVELNCEPAGAKFSEPVKLSTYIGTEAAGMDVTILNPETKEMQTNTVGPDGYVRFEVDHFSTWTILFAINISEIDNGVYTLFNRTVNTAIGTNTLVYNRYFGFDTQATGFFASTMGSFFGGAYTTLPSQLTFEASAAGQATVNITQQYTDYRVTFEPLFSYDVRSWGAVTANVTPVGGQTHSGGSGR